METLGIVDVGVVRGGAQLDAVRALDATGLCHGDRLIALELWERSEAANG